MARMHVSAIPVSMEQIVKSMIHADHHHVSIVEHVSPWAFFPSGNASVRPSLQVII